MASTCSSCCRKKLSCHRLPPAVLLCMLGAPLERLGVLRKQRGSWWVMPP
jgi:hypothetical protein